MTIPLHGADFEPTWPGQLFVDEAKSVLASGHRDANGPPSGEVLLSQREFLHQASVVLPAGP